MARRDGQSAGGCGDEENLHQEEKSDGIGHLQRDPQAEELSGCCSRHPSPEVIVPTALRWIHGVHVLCPSVLHGSPTFRSEITIHVVFIVRNVRNDGLRIRV